MNKSEISAMGKIPKKAFLKIKIFRDYQYFRGWVYFLIKGCGFFGCVLKITRILPSQLPIQQQHHLRSNISVFHIPAQVDPVELVGYPMVIRVIFYAKV